MWRLESRSGVSSYLFGTMHVRSSIAHQFLDAILPFLNTCEVLAAEMNLDEFDQSVMVMGSTLPEGTTLRSLLGTRSYEKARKHLRKSFNVDLDIFNNRHPFLVSATISETLLINDKLESLDQELWNLAIHLNKSCIGLESFNEQMLIMQKISLLDSVRQIKYIGRNPTRFRRNLQKLINFYVDQDVINLYKSSRKQLEGMRRVLLFDRNSRMALRLVKIANSESVFAAVGAAHLGGAKGMLRLVKKQGFKVTPVKIEI